MSGTKNKMTDLRNHLFETLERLNDTSAGNELKLGAEIDRAKAICEVAQTIINSAKAEIDYLKVTGQGERARSEFLDVTETKPALPAPRVQPANVVTPAGNGHANGNGAVKKGLSTGKHLGTEA